jgi:nanoRNase/pAp phosphatase (c-di-AMP/oligoRNAs hydrolase)
VTTNEYKTAERLRNDYWLYVVYDCTSQPKVHAIRDPARLGWQPVVMVEHYSVSAQAIQEASSA